MYFFSLCTIYVHLIVDKLRIGRSGIPKKNNILMSNVKDSIISRHILGDTITEKALRIYAVQRADVISGVFSASPSDILCTKRHPLYTSSPQ